MVNITAGKWRGKSGAVYNVIDDLYNNSFWPFHDDVPGQENKRFWKADGTAWTGHVSGGDDLVAPASTPTFQVGDRVRAIADSPRGEVGRIHNIDCDGYLVEFDTWRGGHEGDDDFPDDRGWWLNAWELERLPVTVVAGRHYKTRSGSVVGPMEKDDIGFRAYVDGQVRIFDAAGGHVFGDSDLDLVVEVSAPALKIEAGKYYRTRDGRKVGPMRPSSGDWEAPGVDDFGKLWLDDGSRYSKGNEHDHLIAEWPAYTSCAAAEVDNLADEYGPVGGRKFKVGDRVVYDGHTAILREILDGDRYIPYLIEFESEVGYGHNGNNVGKVRLTSNRGWWVENITAAVSSPAIVARIDSGQPRPSTTPFVHADRPSAEREAARLASAKPGKEFAVYEFVSSAKEDRQYKHEWQRLASGGETVEARKMLQGAGLNGMQASRVVQEFVAAS